jgi:hypothetical protein
MRETHRGVAGTGLLLLALACGKSEKAPLPASSAPPSGPVGNATVTGVVKFVGKAPLNPLIDMTEEPKCKADYTTPPRERMVIVNPNGTLADVFVYVKSGLPADAQYPAPTTPVVIDQRGCLYHPRVFGIMVGQPLEIRNSDPLLHNIKAMGKNNRPFNISQPAAGMTTTRAFAAPEVMLPVECNVHGWMHAFIGVLATPFFATTDTGGTFTIRGLPAGTYTLEAWHQKYGTQDVTVTVQAGESKTVAFSFGAK